VLGFGTFLFWCLRVVGAWHSRGALVPNPPPPPLWCGCLCRRETPFVTVDLLRGSWALYAVGRRDCSFLVCASDTLPSCGDSVVTRDMAALGGTPAVFPRHVLMRMLVADFVFVGGMKRLV